MASRDFPESDWKLFRELQRLALERFCERVLHEVQTILKDASRSHHARYLEMFRLLQARDEELAHAFNDPRRSRMIIQLAAIYAYGLLEPEECGRFTDSGRAMTCMALYFEGSVHKRGYTIGFHVRYAEQKAMVANRVTDPA